MDTTENNQNMGGLALSARRLSEGSETRVARFRAQLANRGKGIMERSNSFILRLSYRIDELIEGY